MNPLENASNTNDLKQIDIIKIYSEKNCLIVDDFPEIRGSLSRMIKSFGAKHIETAANGAEAIKLCQNKSFDIVLCDYNLGAGKDGQQVLEEVRFLRVLPMTSLFVMITGESSREMVLGALEYQPDDYITKPYTQASLRLRLDKAILRHQALLHIKRSISLANHNRALEQCTDMIDSRSRYAMDCLKIKAQLHFLLKQFNASVAIYQSVLMHKPLIWAKIGLGKTLLAQNKLKEADEILQSVLDEDQRYIEAHDLLADISIQGKDNLTAQKALEQATYISPKAVLRHRKLAKIADINNDDETTLKSHQQAIRWGTNSCHESEQDYFNYVRKIADLTNGNTSDEAKTMIQQARKILTRARKRYAHKPDAMAQAQMLETQLYLSQNDKINANKAAERAEFMYKELEFPLIETSLEYARTLHAHKKEAQALELLIALAEENKDNKEILQTIDGITGEAITEEGKKVAAKLTQNGIELYKGKNKNYKESIQVFSEALLLYPKHIGLNLNLLQVLSSDGTENGCNDQHQAMCKRHLHTVETIDLNEAQRRRYLFIKNQIEKFYPEILHDI